MPYVPTAVPETAVAGLSDDQLLAQTGTLAQLDRQIQVFVIDHLVEIEARALHLRRGFSSLFDYVKHGLGYSDGATYRRIGAMKLCAQVAGTRERLRDGSLTLDAAAQLQSAFDRRDRQRRRAARSTGRATSAGPAPSAVADAWPAMRPNGSAPAAPAAAAPELDLSARQALVDEAVGKSSREVMRMLAGVDPDLAAPADRLRPLDAERWELKAVIDTECQRGLEQLKGLLSHVDPRMTLGQLVGRLVKEGLDRHDPARPPRRARRPAGSHSAGAERTSAPEPPRDMPAHALKRSVVQPRARPAGPPPPAPKTLRGAKARAPSNSERSARLVGAAAAAATSRTSRRAIPLAVRREVWQRDGGRCSYVDPRTGRRCASRHLLEIDHRIPYARGGRAERANLRLLCAAHHRHRHAGLESAREPVSGSSMCAERSRTNQVPENPPSRTFG
ncbi:MAG: HNH endonuclease signature motif containing protein [Spirochaetaceae bacterium]|nr:HNH endonuclease signature motif containing protein [Spirochaetaceae bacterium]